MTAARLLNDFRLACSQRTKSFSRTLLHNLIDFIAPPSCLYCGKGLPATQLPATESRPALCRNCQPLLPKVITHSCQRCGAPVGPFVETSRGCSYCARDKYAFSGAICLGVYAEAFRLMCLRGKSPAAQPLIHLLTEELLQRHQEKLISWEPTIIVPVPMHWGSRLFRRVHPNETMADQLAKSLRLPVCRRALFPTRKTPKQSSQSPALRRKNRQGAFGCRRNRQLNGATVLLVDDVLTTAATADACSQALLKQGATKVYVVALARGLGRRS